MYACQGNVPCAVWHLVLLVGGFWAAYGVGWMLVSNKIPLTMNGGVLRGLADLRQGVEQTDAFHRAVMGLRRISFLSESLILAQNERWRQASYMQVARLNPIRGDIKRRTGE